MNLFINVFFLFFLLFGMLSLKVPSIADGNFILHKFIIFVAVFGFQFMIEILSKIKEECKIVPMDIFRSSVETAAIAVIGYSLFNDLQFMDIGFGSNGFYNGTDKMILNVQVTIMITLMITFYRVLQLTFGYNVYECVKYD